MEVGELILGTKLNINVVNESNEDVGYYYISQVEEILNEDTIVFPAPIQSNKIVFIPVGTRLRVTFIHNRHGIQNFIGTITGKVKVGEILYMHVLMETGFSTTQRRKHYRLPCSKVTYALDVRYRMFSDTIDGDMDDDYRFKASRVKNISEGGICLVTDDNMSIDAMVELKIGMAGNITITSICRVVRCTFLDSLKSRKYLAVLSFQDISKFEQEKIVRYIFEQQRYMMKNLA